MQSSLNLKQNNSRGAYSAHHVDFNNEQPNVDYVAQFKEESCINKLNNGLSQKLDQDTAKLNEFFKYYLMVSSPRVSFMDEINRFGFDNETTILNTGMPNIPKVTRINKIPDCGFYHPIFRIF